MVAGTASVGSRRLCSRPGCSERAAVTLTYDYGHSHVWLDELLAERDPHAYDLCLRHAGRLSVPHGWMLDDRRRVDHPILLAVWPLAGASVRRSVATGRR
jgi:Protein of unknown function (DUF3499)